MSETVQLAIVAGIVSLLITFAGIIPLYRRSQRDKDRADADQAKASATKELLEGATMLVAQFNDVQSALGESRENVRELELQLEATRRAQREERTFLENVWYGAKRLAQQLKAHEINPVYTPPDELPNLED